MFDLVQQQELNEKIDTPVIHMKHIIPLVIVWV